MARTVTGTVVGSDGATGTFVLTFVAQDTPAVVSSTVVAAVENRVVTASDGTFTVTLYEGRYTVQIDNGEEFDIDVPSGSGTSDIATLFVSEGSESVTQYSISGHGSPEGARQGDPGFLYTDLDTGDLWRKRTGTGTTGWEQIL